MGGIWSLPLLFLLYGAMSFRLGLRLSLPSSRSLSLSRSLSRSLSLSRSRSLSGFSCLSILSSPPSATNTGKGQQTNHRKSLVSRDKKNDEILFNTSHFLRSFCNHCRRIIWGQPSNQICLHIPVVWKTAANKKVIMNNVWWMTTGKFITEQLQMKKQNQNTANIGV